MWPNEYYRIKEKVLCGALEALKNSQKEKDPEKNRPKKEIERLRDIVLSLGRRDRSSKKGQLGLLGPISDYRLSAEVKKKLLAVVQNSFLPAKRACRVLGLKPKRFYRWRKKYSLFEIDGLVDEEPIGESNTNIVNAYNWFGLILTIR